MKKLTLVGTILTGCAAVVGAINLLADNFAGKKKADACAPVEEAPKEAEETEPEAPEEEEAPAEE